MLDFFYTNFPYIFLMSNMTTGTVSPKQEPTKIWSRAYRYCTYNHHASILNTYNHHALSILNTRMSIYIYKKSTPNWTLLMRFNTNTNTNTNHHVPMPMPMPKFFEAMSIANSRYFPSSGPISSCTMYRVWKVVANSRVWGSFNISLEPMATSTVPSCE